MPSCINCGKEYQAGDNYCAGCGDILSKENEVQSKKIKLEEQIPYYKSSNRNFLWYFFILFIAGLIIFYYSWRPSPAHKGSRTFKNPITSFFKEMNTKAKMKKKGGCHIIIQLSPLKDPDTGKLRPINDEIVERTMEVLEKRLNRDFEVTTQEEGEDRIIIDIAGDADIKKAEEMITKTGLLEFQERSYDQIKKQTVWRTVIDGSAIADADVVYGPGGTSNPEVEFSLTKEGAKRFAEITERNVGKQIAIVFDKVQISAPIVKMPISGGRGIISGNLTINSANDLALYLKAGALPADVKILESVVIAPGSK